MTIFAKLLANAFDDAASENYRWTTVWGLSLPTNAHFNSIEHTFLHVCIKLELAHLQKLLLVKLTIWLGF